MTEFLLENCAVIFDLKNYFPTQFRRLKSYAVGVKTL